MRLPGKSGAAHLLEHMAFKGTSVVGTKDIEKERPLLAELDKLIGSRVLSELSPEEITRVQEVRKELDGLWESESLSEEYRKRGGVGLNATTSKELTNYFINLPKSSFEYWCWIESARLRDPVYRQFYKERDVVMEERRMRYENDPGGKLYEALLTNAFDVHPYRHPVIGYAEEVSRLEPKDTKELHQQYYVPKNIVVSLVGDIDPDKDFEMIEKYFGSLQGGDLLPPVPAVEPRQIGEKRFTVEHPSEPQIAIAYHKPSYPHPDDAALSVLSEVFGGGRTSPLHKELVQERKLAVQFSFFEAPGVGSPNLLVFYGVPRAPHTSKELLGAFDGLVRVLKNEAPSLEDIAIAKRSLALQQLSSLKSNLGLARDLSHAEQIFGDWRSLFRWYEEVMKVSRDDLLRVARQYLVEDQRTIGFLQKAEVVR